MENPKEAAVRVYTKLKKQPKKYSFPREEVPNFERVFVFDTETRADENQALTFGSFVIVQGNVTESFGIFYDPQTITSRELSILIEYRQKDPLVKLYTLEEFIHKVFYPIVYDQQVPCIAFNLPFDISRLAVDYGYARRKMLGGFTFKLDKNEKAYPPIIIKKKDGDALIRFQHTKISKFKGYFVDCQNLAIVLIDRKRISLSQACERFNKKHQKLGVAEHGKITKEYIDYNVEDTLATAELFGHLKEEYARYSIQLPLTKVHSSASMGKAMLEELGIRPFQEQNPNFSSHLLGKISQAYYGGRCEARIRKTPTEVSVLDFSSMYPTLFILLGLYDFLIAEKIDFFDDTKEVQMFLEQVTAKELQKPETWKKLNVIVELVPDDDLLPVRAKYNNESFTVGLNHISSKHRLWYGLPSLILSKLITGKTPKIKSAIRFVAVGKQKTLKKSTILKIEINPKTDNLFKLLVEEKEKSKMLKDGRDKAIKILANATSYGIFIELNKDETERDLTVYSGGKFFSDFKRVEKEGKYYCPIIAMMITDGAKLLLGLGDVILKNHDAVIAYTDTDSMFVPMEYTNKIVDFYDSLNPYSNITHLLKIEESAILLYAISAKRYVLYRFDNGKFVIDECESDENYSLHGLGHLLNPFGKQVKRWQKLIWEDILRLHYEKISLETFLNKYRNFYVISQFTVSTTSLMKRFGPLNKNNEYRKNIKPFNFFNIGFGNQKDVKPIAPYSKDSQTMPYSYFIDYVTGKKMKGQQYFKSLADELWSYIEHPEAKLNGTHGMLQRKHLQVDRLFYIGKEVDKIEENMSGLDNLDQNVYQNPKEAVSFFSRPWKEVKECGISKMQFYRIRKKLNSDKKLILRKRTLIKVQSNY